MKTYKKILIIGVTFLMFGCLGGNNKPKETQRYTPDYQVSGVIQDGYRILPINMQSEALDLIVYMGDHIKFKLDDHGSPLSEYPLLIPKMDVNIVLSDNQENQPHFKLDKSGNIKFKIGDRIGSLDVRELEQANYADLSAKEAWEMINKIHPFILDVRTHDQFSRGYIRGAMQIPMKDLKSRYKEIERYRNQPILIYCSTGDDSPIAAGILLDQDFKDIMNLNMGIMGWGSKGYNIEFQ